MYKYALLLDSLHNTDVSKMILEQLYTKSQYDVTIFLLNKENMVPNNLPVFNIADYFNFKGVSIVTSQWTLDKVEKYPGTDLIVVIGEDVPNYVNVKEFNLDLVEQKVNEYFRTEHEADERAGN